MMSDEAAEKASHAPSTSFTVDLHKWKTVMGAYRDGGHMYHATMPTDAIKIFRDVVHETEKFGLKEAEKATWDLGMGVRKVLKDKGYTSVAAEGWEAPGVAVVAQSNSCATSPEGTDHDCQNDQAEEHQRRPSAAVGHRLNRRLRHAEDDAGDNDHR